MYKNLNKQLEYFATSRDRMIRKQNELKYPNRQTKDSSKINKYFLYI